MVEQEVDEQEPAIDYPEVEHIEEELLENQPEEAMLHTVRRLK